MNILTPVDSNENLWNINHNFSATLCAFVFRRLAEFLNLELQLKQGDDHSEVVYKSRPFPLLYICHRHKWIQHAFREHRNLLKAIENGTNQTFALFNRNSCKYASHWQLRENLKWQVKCGFSFSATKDLKKNNLKNSASLPFETEYVCPSSHICSHLLISTAPLLPPAKPKLPFVTHGNSSLGIHKVDYQPRELMFFKKDKVMFRKTDPQPTTVGFSLLSWIANTMQIKTHTLLQPDNILFAHAHN